ncbi:porin [Pseudoalteromonas marina]|uniref:Porin domain-containing protein n=1 Tax=Pseudoalteromonas marina TaxID=267375 RepID=A0ABT9FGF5_9GAMM|nr:porin [Pseudoalteromonas marina]MDP2565868.1 hypothetical protein [Pseudoalteromonas marina]
MKLKMSILSLSLLAACSAQAEQIKMNGYFNGVYSHTDEGSKVLNTEKGGSFTEDSNIGVKATFIKNNNVSGTAQISLEKDDDGEYDVLIDEGYLRYTLNEKRFVEVGKFITPLHIDSNMHNYQQFKPWLINPKSVYTATSPLSTTGISISQKNKSYIYEITSEMFFGQSTSKTFNTSLSPNTEVKYSSLWGGASKFVGKSHTINVSFAQAKAELQNNESTLSQIEENKKSNYLLYSVSAMYSLAKNTIIKAELKSETFDDLLPDNKSYYVNLSQYWDKYEASITYGSSKSDEDKIITEIKAGVGYNMTPRIKLYGEYTNYDMPTFTAAEELNESEKLNQISIGLLMTF